MYWMNAQSSGGDLSQKEGFVLLRKRSKFSNPDPTIKISRTGRFTFNEAAYEALGRPERIEFYFHPDKDQIAIGSVGESTENSYRVRHPAASRWTVTAKSLVQELRLNPKVAKAIDARLEKRLLVADLAGVRSAHEAEVLPK
jgi:hypothetical protein